YPCYGGPLVLHSFPTRRSSDLDAVITASMLPQDVGSMVPSMPNGNGGEQLMGLPLREAREVFERKYLVAQISRFGGNISRTAELDRKSTRLNSSHSQISYAVLC